MTRERDTRDRRPGKGKSRERERLPAQPPSRGPARPQVGREGATPFRAPAGDIAVLYGAHAVREALRAGKRKLLTLYATEPAAERIAAEARAVGLEPRIVDARDLARRLGDDAVHQGLMLEARPLPAVDLDDIEPRTGVVLALDQITDPHNVGAILRTAAAFAVDALVTTERHSPELAGVLAKTASGALEHVAVVSVVNLARALEQLSARGFTVVGLDSEGEGSLETLPLARPVALVLGAEGKGLRRLTRERCDVVARLDMPGAIRSLNVSNACAVALTMLRLRLA